LATGKGDGEDDTGRVQVVFGTALHFMTKFRTALPIVVSVFGVLLF